MKSVIVGGFLGGTLDLIFAISFAAHGGVAPGRVFQTIASGLLGDAAYAGGVGASALGFGCHFILSVLWAAIFALAARRRPGLACHPVVAGMAFGLVVFLCMRLLVLPLSAYPHAVLFRPVATTLDLLSHALLFGIPIALVVSRAINQRQQTR